jgi:hypothetical protein
MLCTPLKCAVCAAALAAKAAVKNANPIAFTRMVLLSFCNWLRIRSPATGSVFEAQKI